MITSWIPQRVGGSAEDSAALGGAGDLAIDDRSWRPDGARVAAARRTLPAIRIGRSGGGGGGGHAVSAASAELVGSGAQRGPPCGAM